MNVGMSRRALQNRWTCQWTAQQYQLHGIEHDLKIIQLADERHATLFQGLMHLRISGCPGQEDDPPPEVR